MNVILTRYFAATKCARGIEGAVGGIPCTEYTAGHAQETDFFMQQLGWMATLLLTCLSSRWAWTLPDQTTIEVYTQARDLMDARPAQAYELAKQVRELPTAEDARIRLLADTALRSGHVADALEHLSTLKRLVDHDEFFRVELERAELLALLGNTEEARRAAVELAKRQRSIGGRSTDKRFLISRLYRLQHDIALALGDPKRAKQLAEDLLIYYPNEVATQREGLILTPDDLSDSQRFRRAQQLMDAWGYELARVEFERLEDDKRYGEEARWNLALIGLRKLRDRHVEIRPYLVEASKPGKKHADEALYLLARSYMRAEDYDAARKILAQYAERFPHGSENVNVEYYKGWLYYDHRENEKSLAGFDSFIKKYGRRSSKSSYIYGFKAWALMRLGRWKDAIDAWQDLVPFGNPLMEGKAYYWQAHAWKELGEEDKAFDRLDRLRERWPLTYYGMLGEQLRARIEGKDPHASTVWWPEGGGHLDDSPRIDVLARKFKLSRADAKNWERTKTLSLLNEKHIARDAFYRVDKKLLAQIPDKERDEWIHAVGRLVGDYNKMYERAWGTISGYPGMIDGSALKSAMAYPRAYREIVESVASEFDLYPAFIWSIMRQESRYKPGAVSYTDAVGALQMIPATAIKVAQDMGTVFNIATFFRPEVGFRFSGFYMRKILDTFSGLWVPTAAAYNTGPAPIARWFKKNPDASFPWLIEEFEYNEGRAYGRKVAEHMLRYLYLYEPDARRRGQILDKMFPIDRHIDLPDDVGY